jgi:hypothetical protein
MCYFLVANIFLVQFFPRIFVILGISLDELLLLREIY